MLRYKADVRTLAFMLVTTGLLVVQWNLPRLVPLVYTLSLFMAVSVAVIAHNHNHLRIWRSKTLNALTDYWITLFYGFPAFAWIPTHNQNHHRFNNRPGDYTITYRLSERNNLLTLLSYPTVSGICQQPPTRSYLASLWRKNRRRFAFSISQYVVLFAYLALFFAVDWKKALLFILVPQQVALTTVLIFNYLQHVHADEESEWNHSRNFVGWALNTFLFNNGFHTIHHEHPGLHWSVLPKAHQKIAHHIDPTLCERSFFWYVARVYLLAPFLPQLRSRSMRLSRLARSTDERG